MKAKELCLYGVFAALYVVLTMINPFGYGAIQLRVSAIISVAPFFDKKLKVPCILGVAIANLFSPLGVIDVLFGVILWVIAYYLIDRVEVPTITKLLMTSVLSGIIVGGELFIVLHSPYLFNFISITASQSIVFLIGYFVMPQILKLANKIVK